MVRLCHGSRASDLPTRFHAAGRLRRPEAEDPLRNPILGDLVETELARTIERGISRPFIRTTADYSSIVLASRTASRSESSV